MLPEDREDIRMPGARFIDAYLPPSVVSFLNRRVRRLNNLAVPFISDDGAAEDDYALLPPPRRRAAGAS